MQDFDTRNIAAAEDDFEWFSFADLSEGRSTLDFLDLGVPVKASVFHGSEYRLHVIVSRRLDDNSTVTSEWLSPPHWWRALGLRKDVWRATALMALDDPLQALNDGWIRANGKRVRV